MNVIFRKANFEDVEKIVSLCNECFDEETSLDYAKKVFKETMSDENQIYLIGEVDGLMVAHAKIVIVPTMFQPMSTYAILNHICVKPEWRRKSIGTKLLIECEKICAERNCVEMKLWSKNFRIPAHECYKSYGFSVIEAKFFERKIS